MVVLAFNRMLRETLGFAYWLSACVALAGCDSYANLGANRDGGAPEASTEDRCPALCSKVIVCGIVPAEAHDTCLSLCASAPAEDLDCVEENSCSKIESSCDILGAESDSDCLEACNRTVFWKCAAATEHAECRETCASAPRATRSTFVGCVKSSGSDCVTMAECLALFVR